MDFQADSKKFRILQLSNAWDTPSGYGVQSEGTLFDWNRHYDVRQIANYGFQGRMRGFQNPRDARDPNTLKVYPTLPGDDHGGRTAQLIMRSWNPDVFVILYDIWMGAYVEAAATPSGFKPIHPHTVPWVMVDHEPIPEATLLQAKEMYHIAVPTMYGYNQFKQNGVENVSYIPFGIHTDVFKPSQDKRADKAWLGKRAVPFNINNQTPIDEDSFLIVMNGANKDPYRKGFTRMFIALQIFLSNNPDAVKDTRVYCHSWMKMARDIPHGAKTLHVDQYCKGPADYHQLCGVPEQAMNRIYGAADVFMHLSEGGGFEIPILEALCCGDPVIATDFVGMSELVRGHGWAVPTKTKYFTPLDALQGIAEEYKAADALEDAYNHPEKRRGFGDAGREFALGFDWRLVNERWYELFEGFRRDWSTKPLESRKL